MMRLMLLMMWLNPLEEEVLRVSFGVPSNLVKRDFDRKRELPSLPDDDPLCYSSK